jgi:hypothetical protein
MGEIIGPYEDFFKITIKPSPKIFENASTKLQ